MEFLKYTTIKYFKNKISKIRTTNHKDIGIGFLFLFKKIKIRNILNNENF